MFKNILVTTDGSKLSLKTIKAATRLAKATGASMTGIYVIATYVPPAYGEGFMYSPGVSPGRYREITERKGKKALAVV